MTYIGGTIDSTAPCWNKAFFRDVLSAIFDKLLKVTFWQNMKLFLCTPASPLKGCNVFLVISITSLAKLTRTHLCVACFFSWRWKNHKNTHLRLFVCFVFLNHVTAQSGRVHVIKGRQILLSVYSQSLVFYILNTPV